MDVKRDLVTLYYVISVEDGMCYDKEDHIDHVELLVWRSKEEATEVCRQDQKELIEDGMDTLLSVAPVVFGEDIDYGPFDKHSDQWIFPELISNGYSVGNGYVNGIRLKDMSAEAA